MLTIWLPPGEAGTFEHSVVTKTGPGKNVYHSRMHNGHRVVDVPPSLFQILLGGANGLLFERLNPRSIEWMARMDGSTHYGNAAFPDEANPPPIAPVATDAAPIKIKMRAPVGTSSVSHEGASIEIGKDGTVTVDETAADKLRWHGFVPV
jgi:hypothetical protein